MFSTLPIFLLSVAAQSGGSLETTWQSEGDFTRGNLGKSIAAIGDWNGDNIQEIAVGAPRENPGGLPKAGIVRILSGADGSLLAQIDGTYQDGWFGDALCSMGDMDGDGYEEILIGAPRASPNNRSRAGVAQLYSGATLTVIHEFHGPYTEIGLGQSVANAGDLTGDGIADLIIGIPDHGSSPGLSQVSVYSGADGSRFLNWVAHLAIASPIQ